MRCCYVHRANQVIDAGCQRVPEDLDGEELCARRLFADRGSNRRAVTEAVDVVVDDRAILANAEPAHDAADVRMGRVNAAVDHGDSNTFPGIFGEKHFA